jgi:hypothetical protein
VREFDTERILCRICGRWLHVDSSNHTEALRQWTSHRTACQKVLAFPRSSSDQPPIQCANPQIVHCPCSHIFSSSLQSSYNRVATIGATASSCNSSHYFSNHAIHSKSSFCICYSPGQSYHFKCFVIVQGGPKLGQLFSVPGISSKECRATRRYPPL